MASDEMLNEIVNRVMRQLGRKGGGTVTPTSRPSGVSSSRETAGMGRRSTRTVGGNMAESLGYKESSSTDGVASLVVLTAGDGKLEEVFRQLELLAAATSPMRVFLSPSARKLLDLPSVRRACRGAELLPGEITDDMRRIIEESDAVYLPNLTLSTAVKIASLDGDTVASLMPIFALMRGKLVVAATNSVFGLRQDYPKAPEGFRKKVELVLSELSEVGICLVDIAELARCRPGGAASSAGLSGTASERAANGGAGRVASTVIGSPAATGAAGSTGSSPLNSPTGPCEGDPEQCNGCGQCAELNEPAVQSLVTSGAARIGAAPGTKVGDASVARLIDHTLLKPDATEEQVRKLCREARQYNFASVCVNPTHVALAARLLKGSQVKVCTVIGFPLGATTPTAKAIETRDALANGAEEIDMVINVGALKSGDDDLVRRDIQSVVEAARGHAIVKVILETALLSKEEKVKGCLLAKMAGADFVKTSTGFGPGGATVEDIALMRETVGPEMGVKASGGVRDLETAQAMVAAGATRIGASASVAIVTGEDKGSGKGY